MGRAVGLAAQQQTRSYSLLDKLSKKAKEAVDKCAGRAGLGLGHPPPPAGSGGRQAAPQCAGASGTRLLLLCSTRTTAALRALCGVVSLLPRCTHRRPPRRPRSQTNTYQHAASPRMPSQRSHPPPPPPLLPSTPRSKEAAEGLAKSAGGETAQRLAQLKEQAAAATSTLGERVAAAQELAKATAEELKKQAAPGGEQPGAGVGGAGAPAGEQQQQQQQQAEQQQAEQQAEQQQQQQAEQQAAAGKPGVSQRLKSFAAAAVEEIKRVVQVREPAAGSTRRACCCQLRASLLRARARLQRGELCWPQSAARLPCRAAWMGVLCAQQPAHHSPGLTQTAQSEEAQPSALRGAAPKAGEVQTASTDALVASQQPAATGWQRQWEEMRSKVRALGFGVLPLARGGGQCCGRRWQAIQLQPRRTPIGAAPGQPPACRPAPPPPLPSRAAGRAPAVLAHAGPEPGGQPCGGQGARGRGEHPRALGDVRLAAGAPHPGARLRPARCACCAWVRDARGRAHGRSCRGEALRGSLLVHCVQLGAAGAVLASRVLCRVLGMCRAAPGTCSTDGARCAVRQAAHCSPCCPRLVPPT